MLDGLYAAAGVDDATALTLGRVRFTGALVPGQTFAWTWHAAGPGRYRGLASTLEGRPVAEADARLPPASPSSLPAMPS